jgi:hypothetical protein
MMNNDEYDNNYNTTTIIIRLLDYSFIRYH